MGLLKINGEFTIYRVERKTDRLVVARARAWGGGKGEESTTIWVDLQAWSQSLGDELLRLAQGDKIDVEGTLRLRQYNGREYLQVGLDSIKVVEAKKEAEAPAVQASEEMPF